MVSLVLNLSVLVTLSIAMAFTHQASRFIVGHGYGALAIATLLLIALAARYREP